MEQISLSSRAGTMPDRQSVQEFKSQLRGELLQPGEPGYDQARRVWNAMIDRQPALIARCKGVADVIAAVHFARENQLVVAVRGGGHSLPGYSTCDGGLVIDLSLMRSIRVDPRARRVRVEGGATWGELDHETQLFGLATPGGIVSTTGVAGLTLGGGYGWLRRKHGLSCDNLLAADVVTADGRLLTASEMEHSDLLWALKGGGGNFGIVTCFEFQLHPVGPELFYAGTLYPAEAAGAVLRAWRDYVALAPDQITSDATLMCVPPYPELPAELHGRPVLMVEAVYAGVVEDGERLLQPLRELAEPLLDLSGPVPYTALNSAVDALLPYGELHCYFKSHYMPELSSDSIDAIVDWAARRRSPRTIVPIRHLGGATSRVGPQDTPLGDRSAQFLLSIDPVWEDPGETEENIAWARAFWDDMLRFASGGVYFNFPGLMEEGEGLLHRSFGANYERLAALKQRYDPTNFFHMNQNIRPRP